MRYAGLGFKLVGIMLFCVLSGRFLDSLFPAKIPWATVSMSILGVAAVFYTLLKDIKN